MIRIFVVAILTGLIFSQAANSQTLITGQTYAADTITVTTETTNPFGAFTGQIKADVFIWVGSGVGWQPITGPNGVSSATFAVAAGEIKVVRTHTITQHLIPGEKYKVVLKALKLTVGKIPVIMHSHENEYEPQ